MLGECLTSGKPTQECGGVEGGDTQAKIDTQKPAVHCTRPSTFKAQVSHSEVDTRNGTLATRVGQRRVLSIKT